MRRQLERWYPWLIAFLFSKGAYHFLRRFGVPENIEELFPQALNVSAIVTGFLATTLSILLSIQNRRIVRQLKEIKRFNDLIDYIIAAILAGLSFAILSGILVVVNCGENVRNTRYCLSAWIFLAVLTVTTAYRVIQIFTSILKQD